MQFWLITIPDEWVPLLYNSSIIIGSIIIALIIDRIILSRLKGIAKRLGLPIEVIKGILFFTRFLLLVFVFLAIASTQLIPSSYLVGTGALIGTALGFGLTNAMSNFISGAYLLMSGLFGIGDYVQIGGEEGIVTDLTVNYTRIRRDDGTYFVFSNSQLLNKTVRSYKVPEAEEEVYIYPIEFSLGMKGCFNVFEKIYESIRKAVEGKVMELSYEIAKTTKSEVTFRIKFKVDNAYNIPIIKREILKIIAEHLQEE
ncbi:MAG: mechanosensitive ion channel domain-containing protein [Candidatus Njordarchaeia archaeon]